MEKKNNIEKLGKIWQIMKEVRQNIIATMKERKIDEIEFCPDEDDYDASEHDDMDYYDYRDAKCPFVFFYGKYGGAWEYAIKSVKVIPYSSGNMLFTFHCEGIEVRDQNFDEDETSIYSMIDVYESISRELGI